MRISKRLSPRAGEAKAGGRLLENPGNQVAEKTPGCGCGWAGPADFRALDTMTGESCVIKEG